jgi:hypothetical protein
VSEIRWRIPPEGDPGALRLAVAQIALATIVAALILLVAAPREIVGIGLVALVPVAVFMAYRQWFRYRQKLAGPDNTWIDDEGIHWHDRRGTTQTLPRSEVVAFRIGPDDDTLRPVPALTLHLSGNRESQPLELHDPATPAAVRRLFVEAWQISERPGGNGRDADYDLAIDVYSECHEEFQEWHLEGTAAALDELFKVVANAAELPLSPPGVKPLRRMVLARRREASRLAIEHDRQPRIGHDTIAGPAEMLAELARIGNGALADVQSDSKADRKFDLVLCRGNVWTFHLHVRELAAPAR